MDDRHLGKGSPLMTRIRRSITTAAILAGLALTVAGCGSDNEPNTLPTESASSSTPPPSSSPSPAAPAWQANYTSKQVKAYEEALQRWESYENRSESIWAKGKVTPAAEALFKDYFIVWQNQLNTLRFYEQVGDKVVGLPTVIRSRPSEVTTFKGGINVTIQQCIDPSTVKVEHAPGAQVQEKNVGPYIRRISLTKTDAKPYRVSELFDVTSGKKVKPCGR